MEDNQQPVDTQKSSMAKKSLKRSWKRSISLLCGVLVILALAVSSAYLLFIRTPKSDDVVVTDDCSWEIIQEAAEALGPPPQAAELEKIVHKITALPKYREDPNCLYPVLKRHLSQGEYTAAQDLFREFEAVYNKGFSGIYGTSLEVVRAQIEFINTLEKETEKNVLFIPVNQESSRE